MNAYDLVVIGSGPAGQRAAIAAAKLGRRVAVVERHPDVGGAMVAQRRVTQMTSADLLGDLGSNSDFAWLVQQVSQDRLAWVVVPQAGVAHWIRHDSEGWSKVAYWLRQQGVTLVQI